MAVVAATAKPIHIYWAHMHRLGCDHSQTVRLSSFVLALSISGTCLVGVTTKKDRYLCVLWCPEQI